MKLALLAGTCVCVFVGASAAAVLSDDPPQQGINPNPEGFVLTDLFAVEAEGEDGEPISIPGWSWQDMICSQASACPAGPVYVPRGGGVGMQGCSLVVLPSGSSCSGNCVWCSGSLSPVVLCKPAQGDECIAGIPPLQRCGTTAKAPCVLLATPPAGQQLTDDGCYCGAPGVPGSSACSVSSCN